MLQLQRSSHTSKLMLKRSLAEKLHQPVLLLADVKVQYESACLEKTLFYCVYSFTSSALMPQDKRSSTSKTKKEKRKGETEREEKS